MGKKGTGEDRDYVIDGGAAGRDRLRLLSDVMGPDNRALLDLVGIPAGARCIDLGCGGGDVTVELARAAGPKGGVIGVDMDAALLDIARRETSALGLGNVSFECRDATTWRPSAPVDLVYARFLLTHLSDPSAVLRNARGYLRPGGLVVVEDIDFRGHFAEPACPALDRSVAWYSETVANRGGDANIGPRLPAMLRDAGFEDVRLRTFHPVAMNGGIKRLICVTLERIVTSVLEDGLATPAELERTIAELETFARDPATILGGPRVFQAWGKTTAAV